MAEFAELGPVRVAVLRRPSAPEPEAAAYAQAAVQVMDLPLPTGDQETLSVLGQALSSSCQALVLDLQEDGLAGQLSADSQLPVVLASQAALIRNTAQVLVSAAQLEEPLSELRVVLGGGAANAVGQVLTTLGLPSENITTLQSPQDPLPPRTDLLLVPEADRGKLAGSEQALVEVGLALTDSGVVLPALARAAADTERALDPAGSGAVARALAALASEEGGLPTASDPRLIPSLAAAAASHSVSTRVEGEQGEAAGPELRPCADDDSPGSEDPSTYREALEELASPLRKALREVVRGSRDRPRRLVFIDCEDPSVLEAARRMADEGLAVPYLLGDPFRMESRARAQGITLKGIKMLNPSRDKWREPYARALHEVKGRELGLDLDATRRLVEDPRVFAALTVVQGEAHGMLALGERGEAVPLGPALRLLARRPSARTLSSATLVATSERTLVVAEASDPTSEELASSAIQAASLAKTLLRVKPRVALLSHASYGADKGRLQERIGRARELVANRAPNLEIDGPIDIETALDSSVQAEAYGFCSLKGPANVLVVPGRTAARLTLGALQQLADAELLGPILWGLQNPAGVAPRDASVAHLLLLAAVTAAHSVDAEAGATDPSPLQAALKAAIAEAARTPQPLPRPRRTLRTARPSEASAKALAAEPSRDVADQDAGIADAQPATGPADAQPAPGPADIERATGVADVGEATNTTPTKTPASAKPLIRLGSGSEVRSRSAEELLGPKPRPIIAFGKPKKKRGHGRASSGDA